MKQIYLILTILILQQTIPFAQVTAPGATLQLIDSSFAFTEGPATDKQGNIFFTDQPNNNIWQYDTKGKLSLFLHSARRSNGMYFDAKGNLISCADEHNQLISISPEKKISVLADAYNGHVLNGPNDVWINRLTGDIYITDPYYQRDYWARTSPDAGLPGQKIYLLPAGKKELILVDSSAQKPNGIVGTPDGKYLYVADMGDGKTYRYSIEPDGLLTNKQPFAPQASDGMTIDEQGNVYLTGNGVMVYDSSGKKIQHIEVPEKWTANLCFGGTDKKTLFITASPSVYTIRMAVKGVE